jgi:hypothetical protein
MKMGKLGVALLMAFTSLSALRAQTVDDIINKHVVAIGGKEKLMQIKTVHMENTSQAMGNEGPSTVNIINGVGYKLVTEFNSQSIIMVFTDKGAWQVNPFAGANTPTALPDEAFKKGKSKLDITGELFNYAAKGNKAELLGKDGNDYKIKVTTPDSTETTYFIDGTTYYVNKMITSGNFMGQSMDLITTFSNYKKGDLDLVFPYSMELSYGGQFSVTTTVNKLELNKSIDPSIFQMPKS